MSRSPELDAIVNGLIIGIADASNRGDFGAVAKMADALVAIDRDVAAMYAQAIEISLLPETEG